MIILVSLAFIPVFFCHNSEAGTDNPEVFLQKDLVLRYAFDEPQGDAHDHSRTNNDARSFGAVYSSDGKFGGAYTFNGRDAYARTTRPVTLTPPYTITAWVYLRSRLEDGGDFAFYRGRTILQRGNLNTSGTWDYIFNVNANGKLGFVTHSSFSRADVLQNPDVFPLNQWVFVAFTHQNKMGCLYQDGKLVRSNARMYAGDKHNGPGTFIGKEFNTHPVSRGDHFWDGMIDELRVYGKALSADELASVQAEKPPVIDIAATAGAKGERSMPAPVFHLDFDDGTCQDVSGHSHHGVAHGASPVDDAGGKGRSMKLDGLKSYISIPRNQAMTLAPRDNRSMALWWKADLIDEQTQALLSMRRPADAARGLSVDLYKGKYYRLHLRFYCHADFPALLKPREWNHLVVVKEGTDWQLYHNGKRLTQPVLGRWPFNEHANADVPFWVGRDHNGDNPFGGFVDEILFFDCALSEAEVAQLYAQKRHWRGYRKPLSPQRSGEPARDPLGKPAAPIKVRFKAGVQTFTLLKAMGGETHVGVDVALLPAWPNAKPIQGRTNALGKVTLKVPEGNFLVVINNHALGPVNVSSRGKWTSCFIVLPDDYPTPPVGRPELRPQLVGEDLVLTAEQGSSEVDKP